MAEQFESIGVADALVFVRRVVLAAGVAMGPTPARPDVTRLLRHFTVPDRTQAAAVLRHGGIARKPELSATAALAVGEPQGLGPLVLENLGVILGTVTEEGLAGLLSEDQVDTITGLPPLGLIQPIAGATHPDRTPHAWGLDFLNVPVLWKQGLSGRGVRVAHLDSGLDANHPTLDGAVVDFMETKQIGDEILPTPSCRRTTGEHAPK